MCAEFVMRLAKIVASMTIQKPGLELGENHKSPQSQAANLKVFSFFFAETPILCFMCPRVKQKDATKA